MTTLREHVMIETSHPFCPACDSGSTYWAFSTVDGDVWYCGSCGHQWTVEISEMIKGTHRNGAGDHISEIG